MKMMNIKPWTLEIQALIGAFVAFFGLVAILLVFDRRPVFEWNSITLNTVVSILSVTVKALLGTSVAECVGQWKWVIFHQQKRKLIHFERIDLASRGPLGSLFMVFRKYTPWCLRLGVIVVILMVAVDPFSQQLVQLEQKSIYTYDTNGTQVVSPRATNYTLGDNSLANLVNSTLSPGELVYIVHAAPDFSMEAAILNGLLRPMSMIQSQIDVTCPTGNCTWPSFDTLGVCSRFNDLTPELRAVNHVGDFFNYHFGPAPGPRIKKSDATSTVLPNGHFLSNMNGCHATDILTNMPCGQTPVDSPSVTNACSMTWYGTSDPRKTNSM